MEDLRSEAASLKSEIDPLKPLYVTDFNADMLTWNLQSPRDLYTIAGKFRESPFTDLPNHEKPENRRHSLRKLVLVQARDERARQKELWEGL